MPETVRLAQMELVQQRVEGIHGIEFHAFHAAKAVEDDVERTFGGDFGIELFERTGGGVAGIGKTGLARGLTLVIEFAKAGARHEDFAAHLEEWRSPRGKG